MGIFDKKYCDICGEKISLFGNRKLEDGNLCKNCSAKLSPFFSDRRSSTVEDIKKQLEYREANKNALASFKATKVLGEYTKLMLDENARTFVVTSSDHLMEANPDLISLGSVNSCELVIDETASELKYEDKDGNKVSYNPARYEYYYNFYIKVGVNNPYFDLIKFKINDDDVIIKDNQANIRRGNTIITTGGKVDPESDDNYVKYKMMGEEIVKTVLNNEKVPSSEEEKAEESKTWTCSCNAVNTGNFCLNCGNKKPSDTKQVCSKCGWQSDDLNNHYKFCPACGNQLN